VLIVEGDEGGRKALVLLLTRVGYEVLGVGSLSETRESLAGAPYDVLVVDLDLPGEQWRRVVRLVRDSHREHELATVVGVSARRAASASAQLPDGLDARLTKPLDLRTLYGLLGPGALHRPG
jgi:DNA-binding response OmpR family regulator